MTTSLHSAAAAAAAKSYQSCLTLCDPIDGNPPGLLCPWDFPGKSTGVGCHYTMLATPKNARLAGSESIQHLTFAQ